MTYRTLACVLLFPLAIGCRESPRTPPADEAADGQVRQEQTFAAQLAAVKAGDSDQIIVFDRPVSAAKIRELEGANRLRRLMIGRPEFAGDDLSVLSTLARLRWLRITGRPFGDTAMGHIGQVESLERLNISADEVTDAGIKALAGCEKLLTLNLHDSQVGPEGFRVIADSFPRLIQLRVGSPRIDNRALRHVSRMRRLRFLHLLDSGISDAGLVSLHGMDWLESFYLDGGRATDDGLERLIRQQPRLHLHLNQRHLAADPRRGKHEH